MGVGYTAGVAPPALTHSARPRLTIQTPTHWNTRHHAHQSPRAPEPHDPHHHADKCAPTETQLTHAETNLTTPRTCAWPLSILMNPHTKREPARTTPDPTRHHNHGCATPRLNPSPPSRTHARSSPRARTPILPTLTITLVCMLTSLSPEPHAPTTQAVMIETYDLTCLQTAPAVSGEH